MKIAAFDFDGTIYKKDTFLEFIKFTRGKQKFLLGILLYSPLLIAYKFGLYPNWKVKEKIFSYFFKNLPLDTFNEWGKDFISVINKDIYPAALNELKYHQQEETEIVIISASVENWILPWAETKGIHYVLTTKIEIDNSGFITGKFLTPNCYGKEKVVRLLKLFPERDKYELWAYGDSRGDQEMIQFADKGWYNKFKDNRNK